MDFTTTAILATGRSIPAGTAACTPVAAATFAAFATAARLAAATVAAESAHITDAVVASRCAELRRA